METFGSDETRPVEYSLGQLRECTLFVGVYAERYGTVDPKSNLSVTELEYREAFRMVKEGRLQGLLVYMLDPAAAWRVEYVDRDPSSVNALKSLKEEIKQNHTVTFFDDVENLSLCVLRDILRKVGVGPSTVFRPRTTFPVRQPQWRGPLGMEHYTERDAAFFRGRESEIAAVCELVEQHPLVLLIGDSGIGKTSLIQAGVAPALRKNGWAFASCRPLDDPDRIIPTTVWSCLMEGVPPQAHISTVLELVASDHTSRNVLIVIDQFEDVIPRLGTKDTYGLLNALAQVHTNPRHNLRLVVCYRGDAEPKVGMYWQTVSGSASGLPRFYLGPLSQEGATSALAEMLVTQSPRGAQTELERLLKVTVADVRAESVQSLGIETYPPFLQMIAETLAKSPSSEDVPPNLQLYQSFGSARGIIGRYLVNQLRVLGPRGKECRLVLISLASRKRRLRKAVGEIAQETSISAELVELCLADLTRLRLVRPIESSWEIVHDFLAQKVFDELVAPEERDARVFRNVLVAKAEAYERTGELLNFKEHLGTYAHRSRITCTPQEVELLFASSLAGNGPVQFFLRSVPSSYPLAWAEQRKDSEQATIQVNAYRFLLKTGQRFDLKTLAEIFNDYKLQSELAPLIKQFASHDELDILLKLRKKKAELTRAAADEMIERLADLEERELIERLLRSSQAREIRLACRILIPHTCPTRLEEYRAGFSARSLGKKVEPICGLGTCGTWADIRLLLARLKARRTPAREREVCAHAVAFWAQRNRRPSLLRNLILGQAEVCRGVLGALEGDRTGVSIQLLLNQQKRFPEEVAQAVRRTAGPSDVHALRRFLKKAHLDQDIRDILIGFLAAGGAPEVQFALQLIASKDYEVNFWNVPVLAKVLGEAADTSLKPWLLQLIESDEFWRYVREEERGERPLPVKSPRNLYLFKRLVGVALVRICDESDWEVLKKLVFHDYWPIRMAAAEKVSEFGGSRELDELVEAAQQKAKEEPDQGIMHALQLLDWKLYGEQ